MKRIARVTTGGAAPPAARLMLVAATIIFTTLSVAGCQLSETELERIAVRIEADGQTRELEVPTGSSVATALEAAGVEVGPLDRSDPPVYTLLSDGNTVRIVRVAERFRTELRSIPFDRQLLRNESLPEGEERLVQSGVNGQEELTYRAILEDGAEISEAVIKTLLVSSPVPEIVMIGSRSSLAAQTIPGRLAYLSAGNAWLMEGSTDGKRLVVGTGDLDGRVFELASDGKYLLYTRRSTKAQDQEINTLWIAGTDPDAGEPLPLKISDVVHFANWYPGSSSQVAFSTVEPRANAPGWQANNDLFQMSIGGAPARILDAQSGGIYGWWGTSFEFSPNGRLAYSRPDGIGLVIQDGGYLAPLLTITPLQTHGDWAWSPGIAWGSDSETLFFVDHVAAPSAATPEESPRFDLKALSLASEANVTLAENVGMFALPSASPRTSGNARGAYKIAFLQAIFPEQSDVSRYRVAVMDRDGSDRQELFPSADVPGIEPRRPAWAPGEIPGQSGEYLCIIYQGNLWLVDSGNGQARQITGDGLISAVDWR